MHVHLSVARATFSSVARAKVLQLLDSGHPKDIIINALNSTFTTEKENWILINYLKTKSTRLKALKQRLKKEITAGMPNAILKTV